MKGNKKIIEKLNSCLADELTAINQYIVHAEMCDNWNYEYSNSQQYSQKIELWRIACKNWNTYFSRNSRANFGNRLAK